jgi:hypothetical protein
VWWRAGAHLHQPGQTELMVMPRSVSRGSRASSCVALFSIACTPQAYACQGLCFWATHDTGKHAMYWYRACNKSVRRVPRG